MKSSDRAAGVMVERTLSGYPSPFNGFKEEAPVVASVSGRVARILVVVKENAFCMERRETKVAGNVATTGDEFLEMELLVKNASTLRRSPTRQNVAARAANPAMENFIFLACNILLLFPSMVVDRSLVLKVEVLKVHCLQIRFLCFIFHLYGIVPYYYRFLATTASQPAT
jgi:hypothetical protein